MGKGEDELDVENLPHACYRLLKNRGLSLSVHFYMILPATLYTTLFRISVERSMPANVVWKSKEAQSRHETGSSTCRSSRREAFDE